MSNTIKIKQIDQTQLAAFVNDILDGTGAVYTANRALVTDGAGDVTTSSVTATELGYLSGVTSAIQTQFNNLGSTYLALAGGTMTGPITLHSSSLLKWGDTASFPALKRSGTQLQVRLADDSGYAPLRCDVITPLGVSFGTSGTTDFSISPLGSGTALAVLNGTFGAINKPLTANKLWAGEELAVGGTGYIGFYSSGGNPAQVGSLDTALYRNSAGVIEINNGTPGTYRDLKLRTLYGEGGTMTGNLTISGASLFVGGSYAIAIGDAGNGYYGGWMANTYLALSPNTVFGWNSGDGTTVKDLVLARDAADALALRRSTNAQTFRVYGTYTDGSNFVRASLAATSTSVTLAAQTAGTGADDVDVNVTAAGNGGIVLNTEYRVALNGSSPSSHYAIVAPGVNVRFTQDAVGSYTQRGFAIATDGGWRFAVSDNTSNKNIGIQSDYLLGWVSGNVTSTNPTLDTGLARNAAGVVEVNNGTLGTYRDMRLRTITVNAADGNGLQFNGGGSVEAYSNYLTLTSPYTGFALYSPQVGANVLITDNVSATFNLNVTVAAAKNFSWTGTGCSLTGVSDLGLNSYSGFVFTTTGGTSRLVGSLDNDGALKLYGAYTDASNYVRASLAATSTSVTLAAETAGTGADNIDLNLVPAGTGQTVVTSLYAHRDFSTAYSNGKMIQATGVDGRTITFGTAGGYPAIAFGDNLTTNFASNGKIYGQSGGLELIGGAGSGPIRFYGQLEQAYPATFFVANGGGVITRNYLAICDSSAAATDGADVVLRRDAANTLALRNGSNGQKLRVYGDYTGASQYCALEMSCTQTGGDYFSHYIGPVNAGGGDYWNDNRGEIGGWAFLTISAMANASGDAGALFFKAGGYYFANALEGGQNAYFDGRGSASPGSYGHKNYFSNTNTASHTLGLWQPNGHTKSALTVYTNSVLKADITSTGAFRSYGAWTDDSNYVRASLSAAASSVTLAAETAGTGADDVSISINPAGTGVVGIGGLTSSYPALKRSSTELQVRLADDSGYATTAAGCFTSHGSIVDPSSAGYWMLRHRNSDGGAYWGFSQKSGGTGDIQVWIEGYARATLGSHIVVANTNGGFSWSTGPGSAGNNLSIIRDTTDVVAIYGTTNAALRLYGAYTDASNYVRASLAATSTSVTLAAETAGTGADNVDVYVTPAGSGLVQLGAGANKATVDQFGQVTASGGGTLTSNTSSSFGAFQVCWGNGEGIGYGGTIFRSGFRLTWSQYGNQAQAGHEDTGLARNAAGVVEVNNGTPGTFRDIKARNFYFGDSAYFIFNGSRTYSSHNLVAPAIVVGSVEPIDVILERDASAILALRNSTNAQTFRVYGTYTDGSNYVRASLAATSTAVTLSAETAGTGADDIDIAITPAGTGLLKFGSHSAIAAETVTGYITIKDSGGTSRKIAVVS